MDQKPIRYGIVGFGGIAENRIAKEGFALDSSRFPDADLPMKLIAATDINLGRREAAEALGLAWHDSIEDLLSSESIDAVYIATSNSTHFAAAKDALEVGKPVMIEKPVATTLKDAQELRDLAAAKGLSLSVDHMMTRNTFNIRGRDLITEGRLGVVEHIVLHMEFLYGSTPEEAGTWRCSNPAELGGPIGDVGTHCLYVAEFLLESPIAELQCIYTPATLEIAVENGAVISFKMENGITGMARVAFNQPRGGDESTLLNLGYEIYGTEGTLRNQGSLFQLSGHPDEIIRQSLILDSGGTSEEINVEGFQNIYQAQIAAHARSIKEDCPLNGSEAVRNLEMVFACHDSARNNGKLRILPKGDA